MAVEQYRGIVLGMSEQSVKRHGNEFFCASGD